MCFIKEIFINLSNPSKDMTGRTQKTLENCLLRSFNLFFNPVGFTEFYEETYKKSSPAVYAAGKTIGFVIDVLKYSACLAAVSKSVQG